jgi:hypothetical protein
VDYLGLRGDVFKAQAILLGDTKAGRGMILGNTLK